MVTVPEVREEVVAFLMDWSSVDDIESFTKLAFEFYAKAHQRGLKDALTKLGEVIEKVPK